MKKLVVSHGTFTMPYQLLRKMRLTVYLLIISILSCYSAESHSQVTKLTMVENNSTLLDIIRSIENQSEFRFFYNEKVNVNSRISLSVTDKNVLDILDQALLNSSVKYKVIGKQIALYDSDEMEPFMVEVPPLQRKVSGRVTDKSGIPLPGVSVVAKGTMYGVFTDTEGYYELILPDNAKFLTFSFVGLKTMEIEIANQPVINVVLEEYSVGLDEVVVIGYGTQKRANLTGAVGQLNANDISMRPLPDIITSLQGLIPGLNIKQNTGDPRNPPEINIRGFNSINGGSPLVLIDGIEGDLNRINPADIENFSILKDAASASIYGSRGAFGVILVTTKRGTVGKTLVDYSNNFGWTTPTTRTDYLSDPYLYAKTIDDAIFGYNGTSYSGYTEQDYEIAKKVANGEIEPYKELLPNGNYKFFYNTNWFDYLFRKWQPSMSHNISISGGTEKLKGYLSGRYYKTKTIENLVDAYYNKYNLKANIAFQATDWLEISDDIQFNQSEDIIYGGYKSGWGGMWSTTTWYYLFAFHPTMIDGIPFDNWQGGPAALAAGNNWQKSHSEQLINTISAKLTPIKDLVINFDVSKRITQEANSTRLNRYQSLLAPKLILNISGINRLTEYRNRSFYNAINLYGTYSKSIIDNHNFKLMLGFNQEDFEADNVIAEQGDLLIDDLANLSLGTNILRASGSASLWAVRGFFGRFNYDFRNKYLLEINARYDGSSRFPVESRWGFFPSVSLGWYLSREKFWEPIAEIVNTFKLRGSYGKLGNQTVGLYTFSQTMGISQSTWLVNNSKLTYASVPDPLPSVVTWEKTTTLDFGADLGFLNDKLLASFDWYNKDITDMYLPGTPIPSVFGASEPKENVASLRVKGFELNIGYRDDFTLAGAPLTIRASMSLSNSVGTITKYPNPEGIMSDYWEGQRLGEIWGFHIEGQFQSDEEAQAYQATFSNPSTQLGKVYKYIINTVQNTQWKGLRAGDIKYVDKDGDGEISKGAYTLDDHGDLEIIGNAMPQFPFGFTIGADWKGFDLSLVGSGVIKQDWYPTGMLFWGHYERPYVSFIRKDLLDNAWSPDNPSGIYPQKYRGYVSLGAERSLGEVNDYYLLNVGFMKIKNLTFGYTFPKTLTRKIQVDRLRIYFSGENIFTVRFGNLTKYVDPEQAGSGISFSNPGSAVSRSRLEEYPYCKVYSLGVNVTL